MCQCANDAMRQCANYAMRQCANETIDLKCLNLGFVAKISNMPPEASGVPMFFEISLIFSLRSLRLLCAFAFK